MFQEAIIKKLLVSRGVPADQVDMLLAVVKKNPELFQKIATEVQEKIKNGQEQIAASQEVLGKYQEEIKQVMTESKE